MLTPNMRAPYERANPTVEGLDGEDMKALFHKAVTLHPEGVRKTDFLPLPTLGPDFMLRYFSHRGYGNDVEFAIFVKTARYARLTLVVRNDGLVHREIRGTVPDRDRLPNEPQLPEDLSLVLKAIDAALV
ncbi:hypothetical protein LC612_38845 [Nostoc sp. CHAB 5834]|nr:hypothetical protein [Nostoc sp. CHAB 5834]